MLLSQTPVVLPRTTSTSTPKPSSFPNYLLKRHLQLQDRVVQDVETGTLRFGLTPNNNQDRKVSIRNQMNRFFQKVIRDVGFHDKFEITEPLSSTSKLSSSDVDVQSCRTVQSPHKAL
uniref:Uncharacterized protein n=1 Tax=Grammatophora oceanica TaxID=210454 RepID=A0A7S1Y5L3_9STRA